MFTLSFGSIESEFDKRTITSDMVTKADATLPPQSAKVPLDFDHVNDLCNQRKLGICTKCSTRMSSEEAMRDGIRKSEYWGYLMQKYFYDDVQYGRHFEGSSILSALKTEKNYGCPSKAIEDKYPLKVDGTYSEFIADWRAKYKGKIPQEVLDDASKHKIKGYYRVNVDPVAIAREVATCHTLPVRLTVGENTYKARDGRISWAESDILPLRAPKNVEGGHAMVVNEYSGLDEKQRLTGPNSWSNRWGRNGYFYFDFDEQKGFFTEAWAIDEVPQELIEEIEKVSFRKDLELGMTHPDVKRLQQYLNSKGYEVAHVGAGSRGQETEYFGPATKKALTEFQLVHKIIVSKYEGGAGRCGPKTRAFINKN